MKIEDLMIGDWVICKDYPMSPTVTKVTKEHFNRSLCELKPIPLTEDIIKKNFNYVERDFGSSTYSNGVFYINCYGKDVVKIHGIKFKYVHELQHYLKLLHSNIEIEL